jgi:hypothetical protein
MWLCTIKEDCEWCKDGEWWEVLFNMIVNYITWSIMTCMFKEMVSSLSRDVFTLAIGHNILLCIAEEGKPRIVISWLTKST